jgi:hypothetical protein
MIGFVPYTSKTAPAVVTGFWRGARGGRVGHHSLNARRAAPGRSPRQIFRRLAFGDASQLPPVVFQKPPDAFGVALR